MKLKNIEVLMLYNAFQYIYENTTDVKVKWKVTELSEEIYKIKSRFDVERNAIIQEYGELDEETNQYNINSNDVHLQELLECESEITPLLLDEVLSLNLSYDEMMALKPIIKTDK